jgi:hypothetical protein
MFESQLEENQLIIQVNSQRRQPTSQQPSCTGTASSVRQRPFMCLDIGNFYLSATLDRYEYMKMPITLFPPWIIKQCNLLKKVVQGFIYLQMQKAVWGLPQASILANKLLRKCLTPFGYFKCSKTLGLWKHKYRPISFTLIVNDFGVKYERKVDVNHLIAAIKSKYKNLPRTELASYVAA